MSLSFLNSASTNSSSASTNGTASAAHHDGPRTPTARRALGASIAAIGLTVGAFAMPASAETDSEFGQPSPVRVERAEPAPVDVRPEERPENDVEVLRLTCRQATQFDNAVGCAWSDATNGAVGYQLWRIVDRGDRELVWRGGLDTTEQLDRVPGDAHVVRYAILAVDAEGRIVARSRADRVVLSSGDSTPTDRPTRTAVRAIR